MAKAFSGAYFVPSPAGEDRCLLYEIGIIFWDVVGPVGIAIDPDGAFGFAVKEFLKRVFNSPL